MLPFFVGSSFTIFQAPPPRTRVFERSRETGIMPMTIEPVLPGDSQPPRQRTTISLAVSAARRRISGDPIPRASGRRIENRGAPA